MSVMITLLVALIGAASATPCFDIKALKKAYSIYDITGNYTNVNEYWLKKDTTCDVIVPLDSKVSWYSSSIKVEAQLYYNPGCRAVRNQGPVSYPKGTPIKLGGTRNLCMVKYIFKNSNKAADLRVQIYRDGIPADDSAKTLMWSAIAIIGAVAASIM